MLILCANPSDAIATAGREVEVYPEGRIYEIEQAA
jgi:hypothetical protein